MMSLPPKIPGLKVATNLLIIYSLLWISFEGQLTTTLILGVGTALVASGHWWQRWVNKKRPLSKAKGILITAVFGAITGVTSSLFTLISMALKTGLHAHGPEFTPEQINWLLQQTPLWIIVGLLAGCGIGLLLASKT